MSARLVGRAALARAAAALAGAALCGGCVATAGGDRVAAATTEPVLTETAYRTPDGTRLPLRRWRGEGPARGVVLALHGFSEHSGIFFALGPHLAAAGFDVVAYDQRGFGRSERRGHWAGQGQMVADARAALRLLRRRRPDTPVYILGHSMGAAVATLAVTGPDAVEPAGTALIAPAWRSWDTLPWIQELALELSAALIPGAKPNQSTGRAIADIQVTDDPRIRYLQARDPYILREVRFDMLAGVMDLMTAARRRADTLPARSLVQLAGRDDMVPARAVCGVLARLAERAPPRPRIVLYADGYHYLTRDRQRGRTIADLVSWLRRPAAPLPSGEEHTAELAQRRLCGEPPARGDGGAGASPGPPPREARP